MQLKNMRVPIGSSNSNAKDSISSPIVLGAIYVIAVS
jgi:hypothetical protein